MICRNTGIIILFFFALLRAASAQVTVHCEFDSDSTVTVITSTPDSLLSKNLETLRAIGFLSAGIDSMYFAADTLVAKISKGPLVAWNELAFELSQEMSSYVPPSPNTPVSIQDMHAIAEKALQDFENSGYPFAVFRLTTSFSADSTLIGHIEITPGPLVLIDSLVIKSVTPVPVKFIQSLLGLQPNTPYNEAQLAQIPQRFSQISFLKLTQPPEAQFFKEGTRIYLYVENKPANQFDGILGFQPEEGDMPSTITGTLDLKLRNALRVGESIDFNWRRLQNQTQNLKASAGYPFILSSNLGIAGKLDLYRRDTTFSTTSLRGSLQYLFALDTYTEVFAERWISNKLGNTGGIIEDVRLTRYGLGFKRQVWDQLIDPGKGYLLHVEGSAAEKIRPSIADQNLTSMQYTLALNYYSRVPLKGNWKLGFKAQIGSKIDTTLSINELYRIGGFSTLRGFNEESIFASTYVIGGLEVRYQLGSGVSLMAFVDQGWYEQNLSSYFQDSPSGIGIGLNLATQNGAFSLLYGIGRSETSGFLVREGKIHFGFVNLF